ncbi:MAG: hypothetical protein Q9183_000713 [Haloplaca sp. 2 TL-2023]
MYLFTATKESRSAAIRLPPRETRQPQPFTLHKRLSSLLAVNASSLLPSLDLDSPEIKVKLPRYPAMRTRYPAETFKKPALDAMIRPVSTMFPARDRPQGPIARRDDDWKTWLELRLKVVGVPPDITTHELWTCFSRYGTVSQVEIMENSKGIRDGVARITFR